MAPSRPTTPGPGSPVSEGSRGLTQRLRVSTWQALRTPSWGRSASPEVICGGCGGASGAVTRLCRTRGSQGPAQLQRAACGHGVPRRFIWGGAQRGRTAAPSPGGLPAPLVRGSRHHPRVEPRSSAASSSSRQGTGFLSELCLLLAADTGLSSGEQREPSYQVQGPWFPSSGGWLICSTSPLVCLWWLSNTSNRCFPVLSRVSNCSLGEVWSPGRSLGQAGSGSVQFSSVAQSCPTL